MDTPPAANTSPGPEVDRTLIKVVLDWQERQAQLVSEAARRDLRWKNIRGLALAIAIALSPILSIAAFKLSITPPALAKGYAALVRIEGTIEPGSRASAMRVNERLEEAFSDPNAKGVVLAIDSPGGTPVQASLINRRIRTLRAEHPGTKLWVVGEDMLTSGAYLVAVASDHICVDPSTITGSIGVRMDGWGLQGLLSHLDIERRSFAAGSHKDRLDMYRPLTDDDKQKINRTLSALHQQFIDAVTRGRGARLKSDPANLYSGDFWTGAEAVKLGLVDRTCSLADILKTEFGVDAVRDFSPPQSVLSSLTDSIIKSASTVAASTISQATGFRPMLIP